MKKSCNNCRANNDGCELRYKTKAIMYNHMISEYKPDEECPKPKNYNEYLTLLDYMRNGATKEEILNYKF